MRTRLTTVATLLAVAGLAAQDNPQLPVFRTSSDLVRVDMYPTRDGQFVADLRPEEVDVYEDDVRQKVEGFELVRVDGQPTPAAPAAAPGQDGRSRVFVLFVDTLSTEFDSKNELRLALVRFLDQLLGPNDLIGLMTPDMAASELKLARRSTVISDFANDARWLPARPSTTQDLKEFGWENCYGSPRGPTTRLVEMKARYRGRRTIEALNDLVAHLRGLREERKAVMLVTAGWPFAGNAALSTPGRNESEACAIDRKALDRLDFNQMLRSLTRTANRANVSFYPVSSRREQVFNENIPAALVAEMRQRDKRTLELVGDQLRDLAGDTDGLAEVKSTRLDSVTTRIIGDTSTYYLLGYRSTNTKADGRFHDITVKVNRPGVRVRARRGYGGESPMLTRTDTAPAKPVVDNRVVEALTSVERFDSKAPLWSRASTWESAAVPGGSFWYVGELGADARLQRTRSGSATADVEVVAPDKTQVFKTAVDLAATASSFSIRVPTDGNLAAGDYSVRVKLNQGADESQTIRDVLRVTLEPSTSPLGEALIWRRGPLARDAFTRTADPRFRRTDRLKLELPTTETGPVSARLLDRTGRPLQIPAQVSERADESESFRWVVIEAPLTSLAPGDYVVEATQRDASRVTAFRLVP